MTTTTDAGQEASTSSATRHEPLTTWSGIPLSGSVQPGLPDEAALAELFTRVPPGKTGASASSAASTRSAATFFAG